MKNVKFNFNFGEGVSMNMEIGEIGATEIIALSKETLSEFKEVVNFTKEFINNDLSTLARTVYALEEEFDDDDDDFLFEEDSEEEGGDISEVEHEFGKPDIKYYFARTEKITTNVRTYFKEKIVHDAFTTSMVFTTDITQAKCFNSVDEATKYIEENEINFGENVVLCSKEILR